MTTTTYHPIEGPDPAELTDDEIAEIAQRLSALALRVAGNPGGQHPTKAEVAELEPVRRYLYRSLSTQWEILKAEDSRRTNVEAGELIVGIEAFLEGLS